MIGADDKYNWPLSLTCKVKSKHLKGCFGAACVHNYKSFYPFSGKLLGVSLSKATKLLMHINNLVYNETFPLEGFVHVG